MARKRLTVKTARALSEREALALLQTAATSKTGLLEAIKNEIFTRVSKNENFGIVIPAGPNGEKITDAERKNGTTMINSDFRKRAFQYAVRYVPSHEGWVYAPLAKIEELFGKKE